MTSRKRTFELSPEIEAKLHRAIDEAAKRASTPAGASWMRLYKVIKRAQADPVIAAGPAANFVVIMRELVADALFCDSVDEALRPIVRIVKDFTRHGGRKAPETIAELRARWEKLRAGYKTDTPADKAAARDPRYENHGWEAVKQRRINDEKKSGRWLRP